MRARRCSWAAKRPCGTRTLEVGTGEPLERLSIPGVPQDDPLATKNPVPRGEPRIRSAPEIPFSDVCRRFTDQAVGTSVFAQALEPQQPCCTWCSGIIKHRLARPSQASTVSPSGCTFTSSRPASCRTAGAINIGASTRKANASASDGRASRSNSMPLCWMIRRA